MRQHARHVAVDVQQAAAAGVLGQRHFGEVDRRHRGAVVAVADELGRHLAADVGLRLGGAAADVGRQQHVLEAGERRLEHRVVALGLDREHVDGGTADVLALQRVGQRVDVHHRAARGIDQVRTGLHLRQLFGADQVDGGRQLGHVQRDHVGAGQQLVQRSHLAGVAQRQLGFDVMEDDAHAQLLGQHADLRADVAIAHDAQRLTAHFVRAGGALVPAAAVLQRVLLRNAAHQHDDLGQHQLGHAAGVAEGRVEHRNAQLHRGV